MRWAYRNHSLQDISSETVDLMIQTYIASYEAEHDKLPREAMKSQDKQYVTTYTSTLVPEMKTNTCTPPSGNPSSHRGEYIGLEAFDVCMDFARNMATT